MNTFIIQVFNKSYAQRFYEKVQVFKNSEQTFEVLTSDYILNLQSWVGPSLEFGWEPYKKTWPHFQYSPKSDWLLPAEILFSKWAKYLSLYSGYNLVPYFQWWSWPITQEAIDEVKHLPVWNMIEYLQDDECKITLKILIFYITSNFLYVF